MVRWKKEADDDLDKNPAQSVVTASATLQGGDGDYAIQVAYNEKVQDIAEENIEETAKGTQVYDGQGVGGSQRYTPMKISEDDRGD